MTLRLLLCRRRTMKHQLCFNAMDGIIYYLDTLAVFAPVVLILRYARYKIAVKSWVAPVISPSLTICSWVLKVWVAQHPLGPWENSEIDINPMGAGRAANVQESFVIESLPSMTPRFIFVGDRWMSAPDHLKSHDFQFWSPLRFQDPDNLLQGDDNAPAIHPLVWLDSFAPPH